MQSITLKDALSRLLLPIGLEAQGQALLAASNTISLRASIGEESYGDYLQTYIERWRQDLSVPREFKEIVRASLGATGIFKGEFCAKYFETHRLLMEKGELSFADASALLSQAHVILDLLEQQRMSCAQIASMLTAVLGGYQYNWRQVQIISRALGQVPQLEEDIASQVYVSDEVEATRRFADASPSDCIEQIESDAVSLGYGGPMARDLTLFYGQGDEFVPAYAVILHYNLLVAEFYDHPATAAYEFAPRQEMGLRLQREFHPSYTSVENAYLNNSKGASAFDRDWAWSRKAGNRRQALALADILYHLSQMSYAARRELATILRAWLAKIESEHRARKVSLDVPSIDGMRLFFERVSQANSATRGVLEQRAVDCFASLKLDSRERDLVPRGLGDSVSASNYSRRKLGDVEILDRRSLEIHALEAHGGTLEELYVDLHRWSLKRTLPRRSVELSQMGEPDDWLVRVQFIAHNVASMGNGVAEESIAGFRVEWQFTSFTQAWSSVRAAYSENEIYRHFLERVVRPLDSPWVPNDVKEAFVAIVS